MTGRGRVQLAVGLLCLVAVGGCAKPAHDNPKLLMPLYLPLFDPVCATETATVLNTAWTSEVTERLPEFQAEWNREGPTLLKEMYHIVGKPYSRQEMTVAFTVCQTTSLSSPFLVFVRCSLRSCPNCCPGPSPEPMIGLTNRVFHELIHNILNSGEWLPLATTLPTPLLQKYRAEGSAVIFHLHVAALQQEVYAGLGRKDLFDLNREHYISTGGAYKRAMEIVELESSAAFVAELKTYR